MDVEVERRIAAAPATVFAYFTDAERYRRWQGEDAELDPRPGGVFRVTMNTRARAVARGEFVEVDPPRRVVYTWGWEDDPTLPPGASTVEVTLVPDGDGTLVRVRHHGLPNESACQFHEYGWTTTLDHLTAVA